MTKLRTAAIIASAALLLVGTIILTIGIFTACSAQIKEKEVYEEMLSGRTNQTEDFNATRNKIFDTISTSEGLLKYCFFYRSVIRT